MTPLVTPTALDALDAPLDYCTGVPDGIPKWLGGSGTEWADCCRIHDVFYEAHEKSFDWLSFIASHKSLGQCIADHGHLPVGVVYAAVLIGPVGFGYWLSKRNKAKASSPTRDR